MLKKCLGLGLGLLFFCGFVAGAGFPRGLPQVSFDVKCVNQSNKTLHFSVGNGGIEVAPGEGKILHTSMSERSSYYVQIYEMEDPKDPYRSKMICYFEKNYWYLIKELEVAKNLSLFVDSQPQPLQQPKIITPYY